MKAITLWQPWASLIACGAKRFETRSWPTNYRGPIAIHAAVKDPFKILLLTNVKTLEAMSKALFGHPFYQINAELCKLPKGKIVATAELVHCYKISDVEENTFVTIEGNILRKIPITQEEILFGDWTPGRYVWEMANVKMLPQPIPAKGAQGFWNWEDYKWI